MGEGQGGPHNTHHLLRLLPSCRQAPPPEPRALAHLALVPGQGDPAASVFPGECSLCPERVTGGEREGKKLGEREAQKHPETKRDRRSRDRGSGAGQPWKGHSRSEEDAGGSREPLCACGWGRARPPGPPAALPSLPSPGRGTGDLEAGHAHTPAGTGWDKDPFEIEIKCSAFYLSTRRGSRFGASLYNGGGGEAGKAGAASMGPLQRPK